MRIPLKQHGIVLITLALALPATAERPETPRNGQVYETATGAEVWDEKLQGWRTPEQFWLDFANTNGGRFWGSSAEYPPYREVSEHDTLLIELTQGPCLMYFFHTRWRRAQDVRRWDPAFNDLLGCPHVFD